MNKLFVPNNGNQILAKLQADLAQSRAQLDANIKSTLKPQAAAAAAAQRVKRDAGVGTPLPKHRLGGFHDRLSAPLRKIST